MFESPGRLRETTEFLENEMRALARREDKASRDLVFKIETFDRINGYLAFGFKTMAHWVEATLDLSAVSSRERVRVARALRRFPAIKEAMRTGELSYRKARSITRIATPDTEAALVEVATTLTCAALDDYVRRRHNARLREDPILQQRHRAASGRSGEDGMVEERIRMTAVDAALWDRAITAAMKQIDMSHEPEDLDGSPTGARRRHDAIMVLARSFLEGGGTSRSRSEFRVVVNVDATSGVARLDDGLIVAHPTLERILCDSKLQAIVKTGSGTKYGSSVESISRSLRRAVFERDQGWCQYPGCRNRLFTDLHHKVHRRDGGENSLENVITLCGFHHKILHSPGYWFVDDPSGDIAVRTPAKVLTRRRLRPPDGLLAG